MVYENYARSMAYLRSPFDKHANWRKQAELLRLSKEAKQRLDWLVYYEAKADKNASKTCRHFSIAPKVFYTWKNRFDGQNLRLLESKSKAPIRKRKRSQKKKRITELKKKPFPGYLIALDTIVIYWNNSKRYILTCIDTVSKIAFARMYTSKSSRNAADFLKRMVYLLDGGVLNTLNDNGSEF